MTLAADNVTLELGGRRVLDKVSAALAPGRVTAIIGANGAGKTSLLRVLAGLTTPQSGKVSLDGAPLGSLSPNERARRVGYLPQNGQPHWAVTARELAGLGRLPHRSPYAAPSPADEAAIGAALSAADAAHLAERTVDAMSGGELARVLFARVLAGEPRWILADEPLANLDPPHQRDLIRLLRTSAASGTGVAVILHELSAVAQAADDLIVLREGRVIAQGQRADVLTPETLEAAFGIPFDLIPYADSVAVLPRS